MVTPSLRCIVLALAVTPAAVGQQPAGMDKDRRYAIAPGELALADLLAQAAKFLDTEWTFAADPERPTRITLQNPIRLDRDHYQTVVSALAFHAGLALTDLDDARRWQYRDRIDPFEAPVERTPEQILAPGAPQIAVKTNWRPDADTARDTLNALRPFLVMGSGLPLRLDVDDGAIVLTGWSDHVAAALRLIGAMTDATATADDPTIAELLRIAGETATENAASVTIRSGEHAAAELLGKIAQISGDNHLFAPKDLTDIVLTVEENLTVTATTALAKIAPAARAANLILIPVAPEHGIYEWISLTGRRRAEATNRMRFASPATVIALRDLPIFVATARRLAHKPQHEIANKLRPLLATRKPMDQVSLGGARSALLISGPAPAVARVLEELDRLDR